MANVLGTKIKEARKAAGMTQKALAEKIGVGNTTISNWEKCVSRPDADQIQVLCWALNVEPNYFFESEKEEPEIQLSDFTFAMHSYDGDLTDHDKDVLLGLARQLAELNRNKK